MIKHKFYHNNFGNGMETHNAILDITPYKPEVLIIGTFNPDTPENFADFFYGRNFLWPAFKNLFVHNKVEILNTRMPRRGAPDPILNPTLPEIINLCKKLKLTFADLIHEVLHNNNPDIQHLPNDNIIFNGVEYNLIQDGRIGEVGGLEQLNIVNQVNWNTQNIIDYLCMNPQIKTIYFTRQPTTGIWKNQWNTIIKHNSLEGKLKTNIYTPSARGLIGAPRMGVLLRHWINNDNPRFGNLDNNWLITNGVDINNF